MIVGATKKKVKTEPTTLLCLPLYNENLYVLIALKTLKLDMFGCLNPYVINGHMVIKCCLVHLLHNKN